MPSTVLCVRLPLPMVAEIDQLASAHQLGGGRAETVRLLATEALAARANGS